MSKQWPKLAAGDLCYVYGSYHREGEAGIVLNVQTGREGAEPHIEFAAPSGKLNIRDYSQVGYGGPPRVVDASAVVKWIRDATRPSEPIPASKQHMTWSVEQVTDKNWALARDPWFGRLHWLSPGREYRLDASEQFSERAVHIVTNGISSGM